MTVPGFHRLAGAIPTLLLSAALSFASESVWAQTVKIMPFGDSETIGVWGKVGYRYPLWFKLKNAGFDVDFVGTQSTTDQLPEAEWYTEYSTAFDRDHEGYLGLALQDLIPKAAAAARAEKPDVVLLMGGFPDVFYNGGGAVSSAEIELPKVIAEFRAVVPDITIVLSQLPPYLLRQGYDEESANRIYIEPMNEAIAEVARQHSTAESPIYLVDNHTGFNTDTMFCCRDFLFPDPDGEAWIADNFFAVLKDILPDIEPSDGDGFQINTGITDAWFNPVAAGQGWFIIVWEAAQQVFLSWFTYDTERPPDNAPASLGEPGHRWLTAQGSFSGDTANLVIYLTEGGIFDASDPPAFTDPVGYGSMTIQFAGCNRGMIYYEIPSLMLSGEVPIERVALDNVALCEALAAHGSD